MIYYIAQEADVSGLTFDYHFNRKKRIADCKTVGSDTLVWIHDGTALSATQQTLMDVLAKWRLTSVPFCGSADSYASFNDVHNWPFTFQEAGPALTIGDWQYAQLVDCHLKSKMMEEGYYDTTTESFDSYFVDPSKTYKIHNARIMYATLYKEGASGLESLDISGFDLDNMTLIVDAVIAGTIIPIVNL